MRRRREKSCHTDFHHTASRSRLFSPTFLSALRTPVINRRPYKKTHKVRALFFVTVTKTVISQRFLILLRRYNPSLHAHARASSSVGFRLPKQRARRAEAANETLTNHTLLKKATHAMCGIKERLGGTKTCYFILLSSH